MRRFERHLLVDPCRDDGDAGALDDAPGSVVERSEVSGEVADGLGALGLGADEMDASGLDGDGLDVAVAPGDGRFTDEGPLLPCEVLRPLALHPTSMTVRRTAPSVANGMDDRMDRRLSGLGVFVIMPTTVATPNLGCRTVDSRSDLNCLCSS